MLTAGGDPTEGIRAYPPALARRYVLSVCSKLSEGMTYDADEAARWLQVRARGHMHA